MGVLALICNSICRGRWVVRDGDNNRASHYQILEQAIQHLEVYYDFPFITYLHKLLQWRQRFNYFRWLFRCKVVRYNRRFYRVRWLPHIWRALKG